MPQLMQSTEGDFSGILDALSRGRESLRQTLFGDQPTFLQKMSTAAGQGRPNVEQALMPNPDLQEAAMAFTPMGMTQLGAPESLKELVGILRNRGTGLSLDSMLATLRNPVTGHELEGLRGVAGHPHTRLAQMAARGQIPPQQVMNYERSFKYPGGMTIPDWQANQLRSPTFVQHIHNLFEQGRSEQQVTDLMQSLLPHEIQSLERFRRGG